MLKSLKELVKYKEEINPNDITEGKKAVILDILWKLMRYKYLH